MASTGQWRVEDVCKAWHINDMYLDTGKREREKKEKKEAFMTDINERREENHHACFPVYAITNSLQIDELRRK